MGLVRLDVDNEDEGVVFLNLLHGALSVERVDDDLVLVQTGLVRDRLARILGRPRQLKGLGTMEAGRVPDFRLLLGVRLRNDQARQHCIITTTKTASATAHTRSTYTLKGSLRRSVGLLGALGRLGGTS